MYISRLSLLSFRNIKNTTIEFIDGINVFVGDNAQGKTNILESIFMCSTGRSHRTKNDNQIIMFDERSSHIQAFINKNKYSDRIDIHLKKDEKKGIAINGIPIKKTGDLFGILFTVIFSPEDLQLIKNGPSERRRFMDMELCQISNLYYYNLQQYYKILKQRNNLLKKIQKNIKLKDTLFVWDEQLIDYGIKIINARRNFIEKINLISADKHYKITNEKEKLEIRYLPNVDEDKFAKKLKLNIERDLFLGSTLIGPHKDDICFFINENDVKIYGSQGQQRTAALSAKLAEIDIIKGETGNTPILLLDDVLSELDEKRQLFLMEGITGIQTIITCTGIEDSINKNIDLKNIFKVNGGNVLKFD